MRSIRNLFFLFFAFLITVNAHAGCEEILQRRKEVVDFARHIHKSSPEFYKSKQVLREQKRLKKAGMNFSSQPQEMIADWLEVLEKTHGSAIGNEQIRNRIKEYYFREYIIKSEEIPESYYESQIRIAREQGHGNRQFSPEEKQNLADVLIKDQRESLKKWLDYLLSKDADYPFWKKYWSFTSLLKMGIFDVEKGQFQKRSKGQVALFPELNQEAKLVESLENKSTGWCTAGRETAKSQLSKGDFHVFYSLDQKGNATIPRVAIRFEDDQIVEVRGRDKDQNLDPKMAGSNVLDHKLKEFGREGEQYQKKSSDMKLLTLLEKKIEEKTEFTKNELRFLYEIDKKIEGFGYSKDPRVDELIQKRKIKKDLSLVLDIDAGRISVTEEEAISGGMLYHYGNLNIRPDRKVNEINLPAEIGGTLDLFSLPTAAGLKLPHRIGGGLNLINLRSAKGLKFPKRIEGYLNLTSLRIAESLELPEYIGGNLLLTHLSIAKGVKFPEYIEGDLDLLYLGTVEGLQLPEHIGGSLSLPSLTTVKGLKLPQYIGKGLSLGGIETAEGLELPKDLSFGLNLRYLKTAKGLKLPESFDGNLYMDSLSTTEGLNLPKYISGELNLEGLKNAEGLVLPEYVGGDLFLSSLISASGLKLPNHIGGAIILKNEMSLKLPPGFKGEVRYVDHE